jgi:hypothetical protein
MGGACSQYELYKKGAHHSIRNVRKEKVTWETWCRWQDNIKIDLREMWYGGVEWIYVAQAGTCEQGDEPSGLEFVDWLTDYLLLKIESVPFSM